MFLLASQGVVDIRKFDLCGDLLIVQSGKPRQSSAHSSNGGSIAGAALRQQGFGFFSETFEIEGIGHSTTSYVALVRTSGLKVRSC